jgi:MFS family permease
METAAPARRITRILFLAQSLGSAGLIVASTINAIVAANLSGNPALAGAPSGVILIGQALAALALGYVMDWTGRRIGLAIGLAFGVMGAGLTMVAIVERSWLGFLGAVSMIGGAQAALQLSRFVAAEVHPPAERGRAISTVVLGGTVGAVFGPWLVGPAGSWARLAGFDEMVGPFAIAVLLHTLAGLAIFMLLRPDPLGLGRQVADAFPEELPALGRARSLKEILQQPAPLAAIAVMVAGQMVMVMLMVITSLHMKGHNHSLTDISLVISSHTFGMFAFSIFSGQLADRWGRAPVILTGIGTLILACLLAPLSPEVIPLAVSLFLLGLGWNFCFVGGSSLLSDHLSPLERARTQGFNDLLIGLASAVGSFGSGIVFASAGYGVMGTFGILVALIPFVLVLRWQLGRSRRTRATT